MYHISFIGAGKIATCLIAGLVKKGHSPDFISASSPSPSDHERLRVCYPKLRVYHDNADAVKACDIVILCVKPNLVKDVCQEIKPLLADRPCLLISVAAGITLASLSKWLGKDLSLIRCMPNTPAQIGYGMSVLCANEQATQKEQQIATDIYAAVGETLWLVDESSMDLVTAISGSGPAYIFRVAEALIRAAGDLGMPPDIAHRLVVQTLLGSAHLAVGESNLAGLRQSVTSKKGVTEKALAAMEKADIDSLFRETLSAACQQAKAMSNKFSH